MIKSLIVSVCLMAGQACAESHILSAETEAAPEWVQSFRARVPQCWNIGPMIEAGEVPAVEIRFEMAPDGRPMPDTFALMSSNAVTDAAEDMAFAAARRAVIRCAGEGGYGLPEEAFDQWQFVELTFAPPQSQLLTRPEIRPQPDEGQSQ